MSPGAYTSDIWTARTARHHNVVWASLIAIMFLLVAATSFALDQNVTFSCLSKLTPTHLAR